MLNLSMTEKKSILLGNIIKFWIISIYLLELEVEKLGLYKEGDFE